MQTPPPGGILLRAADAAAKGCCNLTIFSHLPGPPTSPGCSVRMQKLEGLKQARVGGKRAAEEEQEVEAAAATIADPEVQRPVIRLQKKRRVGCLHSDCVHWNALPAPMRLCAAHASFLPVCMGFSEATGAHRMLTRACLPAAARPDLPH